MTVANLVNAGQHPSFFFVRVPDSDFLLFFLPAERRSGRSRSPRLHLHARVHGDLSVSIRLAFAHTNVLLHRGVDSNKWTPTHMSKTRQFLVRSARERLYLLNPLYLLIVSPACNSTRRTLFIGLWSTDFLLLFFFISGSAGWRFLKGSLFFF